MAKSVFTDAYASAVGILVGARKAAGVSQVELARRLGKPQQFVSRYERSERRLDVIEFCAVCMALEADPRALFDTLVDELPVKLAI